MAATLRSGRKAVAAHAGAQIAAELAPTANDIVVPKKPRERLLRNRPRTG